MMKSIESDVLVFAIATLITLFNMRIVRPQFIDMTTNFSLTLPWDLDCWIQFENFAGGAQATSSWHYIGSLSAGPNFFEINITDIVTPYPTWNVGRLRIGAYGDGNSHTTNFTRIYLDDTQGGSTYDNTDTSEFEEWYCNKNATGCCIMFWNGVVKNINFFYSDPCHDLQGFETERAPTLVPTNTPTIQPTILPTKLATALQLPTQQPTNNSSAIIDTTEDIASLTTTKIGQTEMNETTSIDISSTWIWNSTISTIIDYSSIDVEYVEL